MTASVERGTRHALASIFSTASFALPFSATAETRTRRKGAPDASAPGPSIRSAPPRGVTRTRTATPPETPAPAVQEAEPQVEAPAAEEEAVVEEEAAAEEETAEEAMAEEEGMAEKKAVTIGMMKIVSHPALESIQAGFLETMAKAAMLKAKI